MSGQFFSADLYLSDDESRPKPEYRAISDDLTQDHDIPLPVHHHERRECFQVLYVIPVSSKLGCLPLFPMGATGTILFDMRREQQTFLELPVTEQRKLATDAGDAMSRAWPFHGEQNNSMN